MRGISTFIFLIFLMWAESVSAQSLESIINSAPNQEAWWSVTVRGTDGEILESWNSEKLIVPASNQKLYTTAAVLDILGSDFRYETKIFGDGEQVDSVWAGDIIIVGAGDPSISGFLYNENRYHVFRNLKDQLKEKGINEITGTLIAHTGYFDNQVYPKGWDWDDLSFYYGVEVSPLSFNNNAVDLTVFADGNVGEKPIINWFPDQTSYVNFVNEQTIDSENTEYDEFYRRDLGSNRIVLASDLPHGYIEKESLSIHNAAMFFLNSFQHYLNIGGIKTSTSYSIQNSDDALNETELLASHLSKPVSELVEWTNKESDNFYAEMLLKTIAAEETGEPGTFDNGVKIVRNFLGSLQIDTTYVVMKDGSGMASGNFTKTSVLSDFLVKMRTHPEFEIYLKSLSTAGIDGTLTYRMRSGSLNNNFKGKSGFVGGARTLSGYMETSSGRTVIVSLAANNFIGKVKPIDAIHEQILYYVFDKY